MRPRFLTPDLRNVQLLNSIQLNNFISAVQFRGGPYMQNGTHSYNLKQLCEIMNTETIDQLTALERVSNIRNLQSKYLNDMGKYTPVDFDALMKYLLKKDFDEEGWASVDRATLWQRCTELGSFPTTDGAINSIFGSLVSIDFYADLCQVFGEKYNAEYIERAVEKTLQDHGGADNYKGTNVVIANGGSDPYHLLSKLSSRDPTVVTYLIEGGSHCGDMFPFEFNNSPTAAPGTKLIHLLTAQNIDNWISGVPSPFHIDKKEPEKQLAKLEVSAMPAMPLPSPSSNGLKNRFSVFKRQSAQAVETQLTPREMDILQRVRLSRPPHGFVPNLDTVDTPTEYETGYFTQPVDHFNNQNPATFDQKYYKNEQWAREGGPIFLMIGGEGPSSSKWILNENYTWLQWAKKFGATTYMLEHRYYGDSDLQSSTDMKLKKTYTTYLSSLQMLYDTANFIQAIDADNGKKGTWIVFGGSYAGSLALWMRKLFPNLVHGAVGSSAPLEAKLDYHEYYQVVEASIRGYSEDCAYAIGEGFEDIHEKMLTERGREEISKTFKLNPPWDDVSDVFEIDKQFFFWNLMEQFTAAVQYSGDNTGGYADGHGIPDLCKIMTNESWTPIARIAQFNEYMTRFFTGEPAFKYTFNSYKEFVSTAYKAQFATDKKAAAGTLWLWQTCTEFGFYGTTDSGYSLFGNPLPLNFFTQLCSDLFGWKIDYSAEMNRRATLNVNNRYGGRYKYEKTNVVMTYGTLDPWTALGPIECKDSENCLMIEGTAHCAEMYPARKEDLPALTEARNKIENIIKGWVEQRNKASQDQRPVERNSRKNFFSFFHRQ